MPSHSTLPETCGGLYIIWLSDTHYYGGRTSNFKGRCGKHLRLLEEGRHVNAHAQHVFNLYRRFDVEILEVIDDKAARIPAEQAWLDEHWGKPGCLNLSKKADGGGHSEGTRKKMSATRKGRRHSEGSKKKQSALKKLWHAQNPCPVAGLVWVHKDDERKMVPPAEADNLTSSEGWAIGQGGTGMAGHTHSEGTREKMKARSNKGWVWLHNPATGERKVALQGGAEELLKSGWERGMGTALSWITDPAGKMKKVPAEDISSWVSQGWRPGRAKGWTHSTETREKMSRTRTATRWVHRAELRHRRVSEGELLTLLNEDWLLGKGSHKPKSI